jgi:hypothetical protein
LLQSTHTVCLLTVNFHFVGSLILHVQVTYVSSFNHQGIMLYPLYRLLRHVNIYISLS